MKIFSYFGEIFDYGSQFSFSPGNIRNKGFSFWNLRRLMFKGIRSDKFRGIGSGKNFREKGKFW